MGGFACVPFVSAEISCLLPLYFLFEELWHFYPVTFQVRSSLLLFIECSWNEFPLMPLMVNTYHLCVAYFSFCLLYFLYFFVIMKHVVYEKLKFFGWESYLIWNFQLFHFGISGTSLWYHWIILLGIFVSSGCKGIGSSPPYRYPFWACNKISCVAWTSHYAAVYSPWTILYNCMDNWGRPSTRSEC